MFNEDGSMKPWSEVQDDFQRRYPGINAADLQRQYEHARQMRQARQRFAAGEETPEGFIGQRSVPFVSTGVNLIRDQLYSGARGRVEAGQGAGSDFDTVARHERLSEIEQNRGVAGSIGSAVAHIPAMVGEAMVGGAALGAVAPSVGAAPGLFTRAAVSSPTVFGMALARTGAMTALTPSMYAPAASERALQNRGAIYDPENFVPAFAMGFAQTAILGSLGEIANKVGGAGVSSFAKRLAIRTLTGVGEQQAVDAVAGAIDNVLPEAYQTRTRYGLMGSALRGEWGEAIKHAAVQVATFAAFAALHPVIHGERPQEAPKPQQAALPFGEPQQNQMPGFMRGPTGERLGPPRPENPVVVEGARVMHGPETRALATIPLETGGELANIPRQQINLPPEAQRFTGPREVLYAWQSAMDGLAKKGMSKEAASKKLAPITKALLEPLMKGGTLTPMEAQEIVAKMKLTGPAKEFASVMANVIGEWTVSRNALPAGGERQPLAIEANQFNQGTTDVQPLNRGIDPAAPAPAAPAPAAPVVPPPAPAAPATQPSAKPSKASLIRDLVAAGYTERSPNTMRSWSIEKIQGLLETMKPKEPGGHPRPPAEVVTPESVAELSKSPTPEVVAPPPPPPPPPAPATPLTTNQPLPRNQADTAALRAEWAKKVKGSRLHVGDREISPEWESRLATSELPEAELKAFEGMLSESSWRAMAASGEFVHPKGHRLAGKPMSHESIRALADAAFEKLKAANPDAMAQYDGPQDILADQAMSRSGQLNDRAGGYSQAEGANVGEMGGRQATPDGNPLLAETRKGEVRRELDTRLEEVDHYAELYAQELEQDHARVQAEAKRRGLSEDRVSRDVETASAEEIAAYRSARRVQAATPVAGQDVPSPTARIHGRSRGRRGELNLSGVADAAKKLWTRFTDEYARLSSNSLPATTREHRPSAEKLAQLAAVNNYAKELAPHMIEMIVGSTSPENVAKVWPAMAEMRFRHNKMPTTVIGMEGSPFKTEADFVAALRNPEVAAMIERYKRYMVPSMNERYRNTQGIEDSDPIIHGTQIEGMPINLMAVEPGSSPTTIKMSGQGRGDLKGAQIKANPFANHATLDAAAYEMDFARNIENSIARTATVAAKASFYRTVAEAGHGKFAIPGQHITLPGDRATVEIPNVRPPAGTQPAGKGATSFYVNKEMYAEVRQALGIDQPIGYGPVKALAGVATKMALGSTQEAVYHTKNLMTSMLSPGVNPIDLIKNGVNVIMGDAAAKAKLVELARIGASKPEGSETDGKSGLLWGGKTDPTAFASKFLHVVDKTVRLTMNDAFDRNARLGRVENTETNRRDTINTALGNYNRLTQSKIIVWLRDFGLSPFATAGATYIMQGNRALTMSPGTKASSTAHAIGLRAEMLAKAASVLAFVGITNYKLWGSMLGDDDTPLGALKIGTTEDGKTMYVDLMSLLGATRGARQTGLLALGEGTRRGESTGRIIDNAYDQATHSLMHPAMGPGAAFLHTAVTGKGGLGNDITRPNKPSGSHAVESIRAAAIQANPIVNTFAGAERPGRESTTAEKLMALLGPYGVKYRHGTAVNAFKGILQELEEHKKGWVAEGGGRRGMAFEDQWKIRLLQRYKQRIDRLEHLVRGDRRAGGGYIPSEERPSPAEIAEYRQEMERLATSALASIREQ